MQRASPAERATLAEHAHALLNDWKLLLALRAWQLDDGAAVRRLLRALPWGWRLAFPTSVVKPAAQLFTGWRKTLTFRLVAEPRWDALRALYRELLAQAPGTALLKYRSTVQQALALLRFRPEGDRERAIHDLCFGKGDAAIDPSLEPIATYIAARDAVRADGAAGLVRALDRGPELPVTSIMGLAGSAGIKLRQASPHAEALRDHVVRCATAVESLLRLKEWSPWLTPERVARLSAKVTGAADRGLDIPFAKVLKAFLGAPQATRTLVLKPLLAPMLRQFGTRVAAQLPAPGPITFVMPVNVVHPWNALGDHLVLPPNTTGETIDLARARELTATMTWDVWKAKRIGPVKVGRSALYLSDGKRSLHLRGERKLKHAIKRRGGTIHRWGNRHRTRARRGRSAVAPDPRRPVDRARGRDRRRRRANRR